MRISDWSSDVCSSDLPLTDHPHPFIVEDEDLHRQAILRDRAHFLYVHLERGFARDADDEAVGVGDLRADRGGKAIAHLAEPAAGHPAVGRRQADMLRPPHLILADLSMDNWVLPSMRRSTPPHPPL